MPGGLHPHAHADSSLLQFSVELLSFSIAVIQLPFTALPCFLIQKSNLLKARMKIYSYNDHVGSFLPSLGRQTTTVYSGRGSQHCYEIKWVRERTCPAYQDFAAGPKTYESCLRNKVQPAL